MANLSIVKELKDAVSTVLTPIHDLLNLAGTRSITDINKAAQKNSLTLFAVCSNSVTPQVYHGLVNAVEAHVANSLNQILAASIAANAQDAVDFVRNNLTNASDAEDALKKGIQGISDGLSEGGFLLENLEIDFEGTKYDLLSEAPQSDRKVVDHAVALAGRGETGQVGDMHALNLEASRIPGHSHMVSVPFTQANGEVSQISLTVFVRVSIIPAEADQIVDVLASARNRNNFYNYLEHRAGNTKFFSGFVLNLREIRKQIKRDTSKDLTERLLGSLLTKGGFTRPKMLSDITEFKNFVLIISSDDADRLNREHGINLTKSSGLNTVFSNLNILSLMVVDEVKNRVSLYESNRPAEWTTFAVNDMRDVDRIARLFQNMNR